MRTLLFCFLFLPAISVWGQAADSTHVKFTAGIGFTLPVGGSADFDVLLNRKFNFGLLFFVNHSPAKLNAHLTYTDTSGNTVGEAYFSGGAATRIAATLFLTYHLLGNNCSSKAGLFIRAGFGQLHKKDTRNVSGSGYYGHPNYPIASYHGVKTSDGLTFDVSLGGDFRIGKGECFAELPFLFYMTKVKQVFTFTQLVGVSPGYFPTGEKGQESIGTSILNVGYKLFF